MAMSGSQILLTRAGILTITVDGLGFLSVDGPGSPMNPGAGALFILAVGIGHLGSAGTGFQPVFGGLLGLIGIGAITTSVGVPSITGTVRR